MLPTETIVTMGIVKNLEVMAGVLDGESLEKIENSASIHKKQSNIEFEVISYEDGKIIIEAEQGQTSGNYANHKTLSKRTAEVFEKFLPSGVKLDVVPKEYMESPATIVTSAWINKKMLEKGVRIKQIAFDTGLDRKDVSGWVTGERNMSQIVKAMFYFYFKSL